MRTRTAILTGALLLASSGLALAQQTQTQTQTAPAAAPGAFTPKFGQFDFGFRADDVDGDEARYNRYRDLRGGPVFDRFHFQREEQAWYFRAEANNVGYRDQRYFADYQSIGKIKARFEWNQIPLYSAAEQSTLYTEVSGNEVGIPRAVQESLQSAGTNNTVRTELLKNAFATAAGDVDLRSRRDIAAFDLVYSFNRDVDVKFNLKNTMRSGSQVMAFGFGTSPGLNPAVEFGVPLEDRTTDLRGAIEFANTKGLLSVGYNGSWYNQDLPLVRFDNPLRADDISGGPSVGQLAWWPTNSSFSVNANGAYNLAKRTRASVGLSIGRWSQDETLPPMTVNTGFVSPPIVRATADTQADIKSVVFNFNSRPINMVWLNAKYRYYDYANKTPHFTTTNAVIGDWAPGTQVHEIEPSSFSRKNLDLDASFSPFTYASFSIGFGRDEVDYYIDEKVGFETDAEHDIRAFRLFEGTADNTFRIAVDSTGNQYVSVRLKYERSNREGSGFKENCHLEDAARTPINCLLFEVGEQPGTRHYDIANRDRSRATALVTLTPASWFSVNASVSNGKDEYDETGFGLRDNENNAWSIGFDASPIDTVSFGMNYGREKYTAYQYSRTSNPLPNPFFNDPTRDWSIDQDDEVDTFNVNLDLLKALPKTDIRFSYDLSDGEATYVYGGPAVSNPSVFSTVPLQPLAPVKNKLTDVRTDVQYFVRPNIALGVTYWYEEYKVQDFALSEATINTPAPNSAATGLFASTIYSGYLYRPYKANNFGLRMTYLW